MLRTFAALAVVLALPGAAAARVRPVVRPTGTVSGTLSASWTEIRGATRTEGTVTYTVEDRLRSPGAAEAWVPQPQPDFVLDVFRGGYARLLRAEVSVDRFVRTVDATCPDGRAVRTTTVVSGIAQPHALLQLAQDPALYLPGRTGEIAVAPVDVVVIDVQAGEQEDVPATGMVATRTTGTDCSGTVDTQATLHLGELAGADVIAAMGDAAEKPLRVVAGGALATDVVQPIAVESVTGSLTAHLRLAGPPRSQRARCLLPSATRMARVHSLRAARRLLRLHGFPDVVFVRPRGRTPTSFTLAAPSRYALCGVTLGTRRHPLLRSRRS